MKSLLLYVAFVMCLVNWGCGHREVKEEKFVIEGEVENCNTFMKVAVVDIEKGKEREIASTIVSNGTFRLEGKVEGYVMGELRFRKGTADFVKVKVMLENANYQVKMAEVDPELYVSWMKGKFRFEDMRLEDIMVTLNRWYDCTVSYSDDALRDLRFTGAAEKDRPASYLLELIEMITEVKFQVNGKNILITRK